MIKAVLIINNHGNPRLTKFYEHFVRTLSFGHGSFHRFCWALVLNDLTDWSLCRMWLHSSKSSGSAISF